MRKKNFVYTQKKKIEIPIQTHIEEEEFLVQIPDKMEGLPVQTPSKMEEILVLNSDLKEQISAQAAFKNIELSAQNLIEKDEFPAQMLPDQTEPSAQTHIAEEFSVEEKLHVQIYTDDSSTHNQPNEHELKVREVMELHLKESESDLVVDEAVAQLSEETIPEEVYREIYEQAEERVCT